MGVLGEWWSSRVLLNCFTEASCKASRQESEVMVDWREKGLLGVKAVMDSGGSLTESSRDLRQTESRGCFRVKKRSWGFRT